MKKETEQNLKHQILELENKINELTTGWQRTQADFINFKKQSAEDRTRIIKLANSDLVSELLPVLDNFQLAAKHLPDTLKENNWACGIQQIEKQFEGILLNLGLSRIESVGQQFDPELHEATEEIESDKPSGEIIEEVSAGYKYDNIIIRASKVKVAK